MPKPLNYVAPLVRKHYDIHTNAAGDYARATYFVLKTRRNIHTFAGETWNVLANPEHVVHTLSGPRQLTPSERDLLARDLVEAWDAHAREQNKLLRNHYLPATPAGALRSFNPGRKRALVPGKILMANPSYRPRGRKPGNHSGH